MDDDLQWLLQQEDAAAEQGCDAAELPGEEGEYG